MKRALTLITCLLLVSSMAWSQFIEEFRSVPNRRPPSSLTAQIDGFKAPRDINGNGSADIVTVLNGTLEAVDGRTREVILSWKVEEGESIQLHDFSTRPPGDPFQKIEVTFGVGFIDKSTPGINIYDVDDGKVVYSNPDMVFIGVADFDEGGKAEILAVDVVNRQTVILGVQGADLKKSEIESETFLDPLEGAYLLELKFQGRPNRQIVNFIDLSEAQRKFDVNGDGQAEVVMFKVDDQNNEIGIEVINPSNGNTVWEFDYPAQHMDEMRIKFHGFVDVNGDDQKELFFGENLVVTLDEEVHILDAGFRVSGFNDFNGDGYPEVIGFNSEEEKVQVWGMPRSTSILNNPSDLIQVQVSIEPNPFQTIPFYNFHLAKAADVQLDLFNAQGQFISRLMSGWKEEGDYRGPVQGIVHPGLYFCSWRINGQVAKTLQLIKN